MTFLRRLALVCLLPACVDVADGPELAVDELPLEGVEVPHDWARPVGIVSAGCTATLIADNLVLLAAHCVCQPVAPASCSTTTTSFRLKGIKWAYDHPGTPDVDERMVVQSNSPSMSGTLTIHPDYMIGGWIANDIAVLRLDQPYSSYVTGATTYQLPATPPAVGNSAMAVGYGPFDTATGTCDDIREIKHVTPMTLTQVTSVGGNDQTLVFDMPNGHTCTGDSGGPALRDNEVLGVLSVHTPGYASTYPWREWITNQAASPGNRITAWDLRDATVPAEASYNDRTADPTGLLGWFDGGDVQRVGDFRGTGDDQVLMINRGGSGGFVRIADLHDGAAPTGSSYWENYGQSSALWGLTDSNDVQLVGDFRKSGHDQVMFLNRGGSGTRVLVADYSDGQVPLANLYVEFYGQSPLLNGWMDASDAMIAGDFLGRGYDQVLFINRGGSGGRVMIADFSDGTFPAEVGYWEAYGQFWELAGFTDSTDRMVVGDFMGWGHDQVLFINTSGSGGRVRIADFSNGAPPVSTGYYEVYGESGLLDGWHDKVDALLAGDFLDSGRDQLVAVDRSLGDGNSELAVFDFALGEAPAEVRMEIKPWLDPAIAARLDADDHLVAGDFRRRGHAQLLSFERY